MSVAVSRRPSIVPVIGTAVPTFTRSGFTATRVNSAGVLELVPANQPRFDYDPVTRALKGLLIEEGGQNRLNNGNATGSSPGSPGTLPTGWDVFGAGTSGLTRTVIGSGVEDGISYVDIRLNGTSAGGAVAFSFQFNIGAASPGDQNAGSVFARLVAGSLSGAFGWAVGCDWGNPSYNGGSAIGISAPDASALIRQRKGGAFTTTAPAGTTQVNAVYMTVELPNAAFDFTLRLGGAQFENGPLSTSYIPTTSAPVTRNADNGEDTTISDWFNNLEGTVFVEGLKDRAGVTPTLFPWFYAFDDGVGTNEMGTYISHANGTTQFLVRDGGGATQAAINMAAHPASGETLVRIVNAYKLDDFAASKDGAAVGTDNAGSVPTCTRLRLGWGDELLKGHLRKFAYYPKRLSNADLVTLSAGGAILEQPALAFDFTAEDVAAWGHAYA